MPDSPTRAASTPVPGEAAFPIDDTVGAWVPHGRFVRAAAPTGPLVAALSAAGATLVGKVLPEALAFSLHGANVHYGSTRVSASYCGIWGLRDALG